MNNILELFTSTEKIGNIFTTMEIVKTILFLLLWIVSISIFGTLTYYCNNSLQIFYRNKLENQDAIKKYSLFFVLSIVGLIFTICKFIGSMYYLIECCINPSYIYLKHLINLMR